MGDKGHPVPFRWARVLTTGSPPPPPPPPPLCCHSLVAYEERYLIAFGGGGNPTPSNSNNSSNHNNNSNSHGSDGAGLNRLHVLDLETAAWRTVETGNGELLQPRVSHSAVVYQHRMIVYGGHAKGGQTCFSDVWELDLRTWTWAYVHEALPEPAGPGGRHMHTAHIYGDRMYVLMGKPTYTSAMFWYLDLLDYTWQEVKMPPPSAAIGIKFPLAGHAAVVEGDYLYVFGGCFHKPSRQLLYSTESYSGGTYRYNFQNNTWWQPFIANLVQPPGRYACAMGVKDGSMFIFGGDAHKCTVYYDDFWILDTTEENPQWKEVWRGSIDSGRPSPRSGVGYAIAREALYILGGEIPSGDMENVGYTNELYRYPLRLSTKISLVENTSRWLSITPLYSVTASLYLPRLPLSALRILKSYLPRQ